MKFSSMTRLRSTCAVAGISALFSSACLTPPPMTEAEAAAANREKPKTVEERVQLKLEKMGIVPIPPDGTLIWDGANISLMNIDPRGSWYAFADTTPGGKMLPATTAEFEKNIIEGAIHTEGTGYREWGGGLGMNFVGSPMLTPLDATEYKGITFKAWGEGYVHVGLGAVATMPEFDICDAASSKCYDHFATDIKLTSEPTVYELPWEKMKQAGWGAPQTTLDPATIVALTFTSRGANDWNFNVDDVGFIK